MIGQDRGLVPQKTDSTSCKDVESVPCVESVIGSGSDPADVICNMHEAIDRLYIM